LFEKKRLLLFIIVVSIVTGVHVLSVLIVCYPSGE